MKLLFTSPDIQDVGLIRTMLDEAGITYEIQNETIPIRVAIFQPEIWVVEDADFAKACELRDSVIKSTPVVLDRWVCPSCGEQLEGQFASCWKCGLKRSDPA